MLVICRSIGQRVRLRVVGPDGPIDTWIEVVRADARAGTLRIGITAPQTVRVDREEILPAEERSVVHGHP